MMMIELVGLGGLMSLKILGDQRRRKGREKILRGRGRRRVEGDRAEGKGKGLDRLDKVKRLSWFQLKTFDQELHQVDLGLDFPLETLLIIEGDSLASWKSVDELEHHRPQIQELMASRAKTHNFHRDNIVSDSGLSERELVDEVVHSGLFLRDQILNDLHERVSTLFDLRPHSLLGKVEKA